MLSNGCSSFFFHSPEFVFFSQCSAVMSKASKATTFRVCVNLSFLLPQVNI